MKAVLLNEIGGPEKLSIVEIPIPTPAENEVVIKVHSAALNRRDFYISHGMYPGMQTPCVLGSDGAGEVFAIGKNVSNFSIGDNVIIDPGLNWGDHDDYCRDDFTVLGMPTNGTFAEYVVVPNENVHKKPDYMSWEEAAAIPLAGVTAYRSLVTRGQLREGETVLIPGIGSGVALYLLQMAVAMGAKVIVTSSSNEKINNARRLGAIAGFNYKDVEWYKKLRKEFGHVNLVVDGVGGENFNRLIDVTAQGGRIVSYGATNGPVPKTVMPKIFFKNMDIRGTTMGSPREFESMLNFYEKHKLKPILDRSFMLDEAIEALKYMGEGNNFGKITLTVANLNS